MIRHPGFVTEVGRVQILFNVPVLSISRLGTVVYHKPICKHEETVHSIHEVSVR